MDLAGDEKRIQALFFDLRFEDQSVAPSFDRLWKSAQSTKPNRVPVMQPIVVFGSVMIIGAVSGLGLWSKDTLNDSANQRISVGLAPVVSAPLEFRVQVPTKGAAGSRRTVRRRSVRPKELDHAVIEQAEVLASWQSPTGKLMESTVGTVLSSLPELTQSVKELESYLSINEVKELK